VTKIKLLSLFVILMALAALFQSRYDSGTDYFAEKNVFVTLPSGKTLKILSFGFHELTADMLFVWAIQFYSTYNLNNRFDYLENIFNAITDLEPRYKDVYIVGSWIMALEAQDIEKAIRLLEKGSRNMPDQWIFDYEASFYAYRNLKDYDRAVKYLRVAAQRPGAPSLIRRKEAHLIYMKDDLSQAYAMWVEIYNNATSQLDKDAAFKHLYQIKFEMDKKMLEKALEQFKQKYTRYPADLAQLVRAGLLKNVPPDFTGQNYLYDSQTGKISAIRMFKWKK